MGLKFPALSEDLLEGRSQSRRSRQDLALGECHIHMVPDLPPDARLLRAEARTSRGSKREHQRPWLDMILLFFGCPERYSRKPLTDITDVLKIKIELPANVKDSAASCYFTAVTITKETFHHSGYREGSFLSEERSHALSWDTVREPAFPEHPP